MGGIENIPKTFFDYSFKIDQFSEVLKFNRAAGAV